MSNSLDPDQDCLSVGPDLGPNCLQRSSAEDKLPLARKEKELIELSCCLFDLILYVPSTIFQLNRDGSSCVELVLS